MVARLLYIEWVSVGVFVFKTQQKKTAQEFGSNLSPAVRDKRVRTCQFWSLYQIHSLSTSLVFLGLYQPSTIKEL